MYGTVARYRIKPGMEQKLLDFEREIRELGMKGFICEFTLRTDEDPSVCYEMIIFESKEAYRSVGDLPGWEERNRNLMEILESEPEWHDGEIFYANQERTPPNVW